jgi:hypothetical protein
LEITSCAGFAKHPRAVNRTVFHCHPLDLALGVGKYIEGSADHRPTLVARDMGERMAPDPKRRLGRDRSNLGDLH